MSLGPVMRRLRFSLRCLALLFLIITPASAATNVVTTLAGSGPGSLRYAISNALPGDTIVFSTNGTILLTSGELPISTNLHLAGPGAANLAVSGNGASRVFNISAGVTSSISASRFAMGAPASNVALPVVQWIDLGAATLNSNGLYEFSASTTNDPYRVFRDRTP
jgi:hypothetical protein